MIYLKGVVSLLTNIDLLLSIKLIQYEGQRWEVTK